jgi:hypothetical protein
MKPVQADHLEADDFIAYAGSEPHQGATFYFTIPVKKEVPHAA